MSDGKGGDIETSGFVPTEPPKPGVYRISTGAGGMNHDGSQKPGGTLYFTLGPHCEGNPEVLRFEPSGEVFVRGEKVDDNKIIYEVFTDWLWKADVMRGFRKAR